MSGTTQRMVEAFRAVILTGGVTAGARMLNISQPSVSRLLRDFEYRLGLQLFERRGTQLVPTGEALSLFDEVERSFVGLRQIERFAGQLRAHRAGQLHLVTIPVLGLSLLSEALKGFRGDHTDVGVRVQIVPSQTACQLVLTSQCQFALATLPVIDEALRLERRYRGNCFCILPAGHPLEERTVIAPEDLLDEPFVSLGPHSLTREQVDAVFAGLAGERSMALETAQSISASQFVLAGLGVSIVDPLAAAFHRRSGGSVRPLSVDIPFEIVAITGGAPVDHRLLNDFLDCLDGLFAPVALSRVDGAQRSGG